MAHVPKPVDLPDFDLAALQGFDPAALHVDRPMGRFILVLAAVFNDLKGVAYAIIRLGHADPAAEDRPLSHRAQLVAMAHQTSRIMGGILFELMRAIVEDHEDAVDSAEFKQLVLGLHRTYRDAWNRIERIARGKATRSKTADPVTQTLLRLRNDVAFHYSYKMLARGYERFFVTEGAAGYHDRAVLSDGTTMEATRFYFADAAMEAATETSTGRTLRDLQNNLTAVAQDVNGALKHIVMAYIAKVAKRAPYPVKR